MGIKAAWTPERRARQSEIARETHPWEHSTGPRTSAGKAASSRNAVRSPEIIDLLTMLQEARMLARVTHSGRRVGKPAGDLKRIRIRIKRKLSIK